MEVYAHSPAKAQSAAAFLKGFRCAFAPLRERSFSVEHTFRAKATRNLLGHFGEAVAESVNNEFEPVGDFKL
jgi:hypothetical protein